MTAIKNASFLQVPNGISTRVKSGVPADADWSVAPPDGALAVNTTAGKLNFRSSGAWVAIPTAAEVAAREASIAAGTTAQYWRGDKSWQTLNAAAVGLGNVNNTADANKAVLTATRLATPRNINGVAFDGSANITIADDTKAPLSHGHAATQISNLPWASEIVLNNGALATSYVGFADAMGGVAVDPGLGSGILLDSVLFRLWDWGGVLGGSGNLTVGLYVGSTTASGSLVNSFTLGAGQTSTVYNLPSAYACGANSILRAQITTGSTTVPCPLQIQWRGRYA